MARRNSRRAKLEHMNHQLEAGAIIAFAALFIPFGLFFICTVIYLKLTGQ